jgi:hypothetical protein
MGLLFNPALLSRVNAQVSLGAACDGQEAVASALSSGFSLVSATTMLSDCTSDAEAI